MLIMQKALVGIGLFVIVISSVLIILPFVDLPHNEIETYEVPRSETLVDESFVVAAPETVTHPITLTAGDSLTIQLECTSGGNKDIDFSINDGETTYISIARATTFSRDWVVPSTKSYNFVYDNTFSIFISKYVTVQVSKHWIDTATRDVFEVGPILTVEFAYVGIVVALIGVGIIIFGAVKKTN